MKEAWDKHHLRFTFKRMVDSKTIGLWYEVMQIASGISFNDEEDVIV
jgi:aryl carrier-like protein